MGKKKKEFEVFTKVSDAIKKATNTTSLKDAKRVVDNGTISNNSVVNNAPIKNNEPEKSVRTIKTQDIGKEKEKKKRKLDAGDAIGTALNLIQKSKPEDYKKAVDTSKEIIKNAKKKDVKKAINNAGDIIKNTKSPIDVSKDITSATINAGTGFLKAGENFLDFANDASSAVNTNLEYLANRALGKSKKEATKIKKEEQKGNRDFVKRNLVQEGKDKTGVSKFQKNVEKGSWIKQNNFAGQVFQEAGSQAPILLLSAGAGDLGLAPESLKGLKGVELAKTAGKNLGKLAIDHPIANLSLGGSAYGSGLENAYKAGANESQARRYALGNALKEVGTEKISGGIPGLNNEGLIDDAAEAVVNRATKRVKSKALKEGIKGVSKYTTRALGEGAEEVLSEILEPALKNATYSKGEKINWNDVKEAGLMGTVLGGILNTPGSIGETSNNIRAAKVQEEIDKLNKIELNNKSNNDKIDNIIKGARNFKDFKPNIDNVNLSTELQQQIKDGRYGKKMMLDLVSTQKVQELQQAVKQGQMTPTEANEEMEVLKQTVENQRKTINDEVKQNLEQGTKETLQDFENAFNQIENSNLPEQVKLDATKKLVEESAKINQQENIEQNNTQQEITPMEEDFIENNEYNELKSLVDEGRIKEGSALYDNFKKLEKEYNNANNQINNKTAEDFTQENNEEIKQPEILDKTPKEEKDLKTTLGDLKRVKDRIRQGVTDHFQPIYDMARKTGNMTLYQKADAILSAPQIAQSHLDSRQANLQGKSYTNFTNYAKIDKLQSKINNIKNNSELTEEQKTKQINKLQNQIKQNQNIEMGFEKTYDMYKNIPVKDKNTYLVNMLNLDRLPQGIDQFYITEEQSQKTISELEEKYPEMKNWAKNIWQYFRNQLQNMVDSGRISQEYANELMEKNPHYVRIQRKMPKGQKQSTIKIKKGKLEVNNPIQNVKGSQLPILPIKETAANFTEQGLRIMKTNQFGQELAKTMGITSTGESLKTAENLDIDDLFGFDQDIIGQDENGNFTFTIFNKGVPVEIPINESIARALLPRDIKTSNLNPAMHIAKIQKALITDKNPVFMLTNGTRDFADMMLYSKYSMARTLKTYAQLFGGRTVGRALGKATGGQRIFENAPTAVEWLKLYESLGGYANSIFNQGEFKSNKGKVSKAIDKALTPIEKGNQFIESMPRLVEFVNTIEANGYTLKDGELVPRSKYVKKGTTPKKSVDEVLNEAMYNAADITVNFKRGGTWTKNIDKNGAIYLNPGVQGASKFTRNITEAFGDAKSGNYKPAIRLMSRVVSLGIVPAVISQIMHGGDKDYEDEPDYIKDQYYLIGKTKDGDWIRIPKGRAVSLFESAARRTGRATNGGKFGLADYAGLIQNQVAPANPLESNVLSPLKAVAENKAWSGNAIVSDYLQTLPTEEQFDAKTSEISKWLGKTLGLSPKKVDYLLDQYSGVLGDLILPNTTAYAENKSNSGFDALINPLKSKFTTNPVLTNKTTNRYYDMIEDLEKMGKSKNADAIDKARYEYIGYYSDVKKHLSDLYSEQRDIQNDTSLSDSEKYKQNKKKQDEINKYMKKIINDINSSEDNGDGSVSIGDKVYAEYTDENGKTRMKDVPMKKIVAAYNLGMGVGDYARLDNEISNMRADKNSYGKSISGSKKRKAISYLKTLGYSYPEIKTIMNSYGWKY